MSIYDIPFFGDFSKVFCNFFLERHVQNSPNFCNFLILTPSYEMSALIRQGFMGSDILMPQILATAEISIEFFISSGKGKEIEHLLDFREVSDAHYQMLLFSKIKPEVQYSDADILGYVQDFIEIENCIYANDSSLKDVIYASDEKMFSFAQNFQDSIQSFFKIYEMWDEFRKKNKIYTRIQKNLLLLKELTNVVKDLPFDHIYICGANGTSKIQQNLLRAVLDHKSGHVFLSGLELDQKKAMGRLALANLLNNLDRKRDDVIWLSSEKSEKSRLQQKSYEKDEQKIDFGQILRWTEYENIPFASEDIANHIVDILGKNPESQIGVISYASDSAKFLSAFLKERGIEVYDVFVRSFAESEMFNLFKLFLHSALDRKKSEYYISFIGHPFTIFEKQKVTEYKNALKRKSVPASLPFEIFVPYCADISLADFLSESFSKFQDTLILEAKLSEDCKTLERFILNTKKDAEGFVVLKSSFYPFIINHFAKSLKTKAPKKGECVQILSPEEGRNLNFDYIFITDLSQKNIPTKGKSNKIIDGYLQEILGIKKDVASFEWLDFTSFLHKGRHVFLSYNASIFAEENAKNPSHFLLHAIDSYDIKENEYRFEVSREEFKPEKPSPAFNSALLPKVIFVTSIETLVNNPYHFYVKHVLNLHEDDEITDEINERDLGNIFHKAIYNFFDTGGGIYSGIEKDLTLNNNLEVLEFYGDNIREIEQEFKNERQALLALPHVFQLMEEKIFLNFKCNSFEFTLGAKPDRIDFYETEVVIIDYKVRSTEISKADLASGKKLQLFLQGMMISRLYPKYTQDMIKLYYYIVDIKTGKVIRQNVNFPGVLEVEDMLKALFENLKTFEYNLEDKYSSSAHIART